LKKQGQIEKYFLDPLFRSGYYMHFTMKFQLIQEIKITLYRFQIERYWL